MGGFQPLDGTTGTVWAILENLITAEGLPSDVLNQAVIPAGSLPANATIGAVFPVGYKDRRFFVMQAEPDLTATVIAHILWEGRVPLFGADGGRCSVFAAATLRAAFQ